MINLDLKYKYCWVWKFLFNWANEWDGKYFSVAFYPDYENCKYWFNVKIDLGRQK